MNCRDLEELLSAYADGELSRTQKEFIEEHLSVCADCREALAEFVQAGRRLSSLRELPESPDIRGATISRVKAVGRFSGRPSVQWLRPVFVTAMIIAVTAILLVTEPWSINTPEAMATSIVKNSPEVQAVFNGEEIEEVEVTTKVVDDEGNVLMILAKTEERAVAAQVNLDTKQVTEIIRVSIPDFQPGDEQKGIDIAKADPRVSELLAQGGVISEMHLSHLITADGAVNGELTVIPTVFLSIKNDANTNIRWNVVVDLQAGEVRSIGQSQPSSAMIIEDISWFVTRFVAPVLLFLGILLVSGLSFGYRRARTIAGIAALVLGIIGLFMALYSLSSIWWRLVLSVGIPAVGLIIGITDLRQRGRRRWTSITGTVLCSLALLLVFLNAIMLNVSNVPGENIVVVIVMTVIIAGIVIYALKDRIMAVKVPGKWLRPAIIGLVAVIVLVIAFLKPWGASEEPKAVLARTQEAVADIQYYRSVTFVNITVEGETSSRQMEVDFAAPDRYHVSITDNNKVDEFIIIGETQYVTDDAFGRMMIQVFPDSHSSILKKEATLDLLDELTAVEKLPEEEIEGIRCLHYIGRLDIEKRIEELKRNIQKSSTESDIPVMSDEQMEEVFEGMRSIDISYELWIGKDDYLLRQMKVEQTGPSGDDGEDMFVSMVMRYSDFNQPIVIEPPLDTGGQLLDGWQLVESISNEQVFGKSVITSVGTQEGYDDRAHQEMKYAITITNNSNQTVEDVRVTISTKLIEEIDIPLVVAEPEIPADIVAPGESRTFYARIPFDATGYTEEEILELKEIIKFFVDYTSENGQERTQLIYSDPPYPTERPTSATPEEEDI